MRPHIASAGLVVFATLIFCASPVLAQQRAEQPTQRRDGLGQNAALRYWQAFAHLPARDEPRQKLLSDAANGNAAEADAAGLLEGGRDALLYLKRGAAIGPCDWGLHSEDGPYLLLPHLAKGRDLGRLACAQTRRDFARGDAGQAVDGAADAIVLGRHLSTDLTAIVSYLVQLAVERVAVETLASQLAALDSAALGHLERRLAALPPGGSLEQCMQVERDSFLEWAVTRLREMKDADPWKDKVLAPFASGEAGSKDKLDAVIAASGGTREGVLRQFEAMRPFYEELGRILKLPRNEFRAKFADLERRAKSNPVAAAVLPAMTKVYDRDAAGRTRMTLLKAAIAIVRDGPERAKEFKDAAGAVVEYHAAEGGFELRSKVVDDEQPVVLKVGGKKGR